VIVTVGGLLIAALTAGLMFLVDHLRG